MSSWQTPGWRYLTNDRTDATDYSSPSFDDSGWATGAAAFDSGYIPGFGWIGDAVPATKGWPNGNTIISDRTLGWWLRRKVTVPAGFATTIRLDGIITVYLDGVVIATANAVGPVPITIPNAGLLAVRYIDDTYPPTAGDHTYFDIALPGSGTAVRKWPRDDGLGLSSAPRLHPQLKNRRIAGKYQ